MSRKKVKDNNSIHANKNVSFVNSNLGSNLIVAVCTIMLTLLVNNCILLPKQEIKEKKQLETQLTVNLANDMSDVIRQFNLITSEFYVRLCRYHDAIIHNDNQSIEKNADIIGEAFHNYYTEVAVKASRVFLNQYDTGINEIQLTVTSIYYKIQERDPEFNEAKLNELLNTKFAPKKDQLLKRMRETANIYARDNHITNYFCPKQIKIPRK